MATSWIELLHTGPWLWIGLVALGVLPAAEARHGEELPAGIEVARRINARPEGSSVTRTLHLELTDRRGKTRRQTVRGFRKYYGDDKKSVIFYLEPSNVRDTAFLTFDYADETRDDDQWLYLPALRKVRRISASARGDYFLGTDFTYEEMKKETKVAIEDYLWTTQGREDVGGNPCLVVDSRVADPATAKELGHTRAVRWIDTAIWMTRKVDYYDTNGNLQRTVTMPEIRKIDAIWTAVRLEAVNHKTGHKSVFVMSNVDYEAEVLDEMFTQGSLRRGL